MVPVALTIIIINWRNRKWPGCTTTLGAGCDGSTAIPSIDPTELTADAIHAVDVKLPQFRTAGPELWFVQVESQFATQRITANQAKFHHVVANVCTAITSSAEKQPPQLAKLIDEMMAAAPPSMVAVHTHASDPVPVDELKDVLQQTSQLDDTALQCGYALTECHCAAELQRARWYHRKCGNAARKCVTPCMHAGNNSMIVSTPFY
ncbi:hypothetical protein HPB50_008564 [Hyalomma asiaticum]|uniref:Uncharacterized protein n=1 Tax=Hyalomma asiaticum TaxID=266040 RepID=A0ACB7RV55_HYAAI|nr:hypothetical protein HPB50_008564 [Hyalomma asiaticum]